MNKSKSLKELIALSRGQLIGRYSSAILACVLASIINITVLLISGSNTPSGNFSYLVTIAISVIVNLLMGVLIVGEAHFFLTFARNKNREKISASLIFYGFKNSTDKAILVQIAFTISSFFTMIPVIIVNLLNIPMTNSQYIKFSVVLQLIDVLLTVVLKLFLGFSFYILCDHPEYSLKEIYSESMRLMANKKGRLIQIYLCFIPAVIVGMLACYIGVLWVEAFAQTLLVNFYLDAIGEDLTPKEPNPDPDGYSI